TALLLGLISAFGALAGALILLALDNPSFRVLVPWLLLAATALFAAGPWLKPAPNPGGEAAVGSLVGSLAQ
ncbi:MAG: sulfite exporter TauE/SafE family protein, partial [Mesorhizobium sp.]